MTMKKDLYYQAHESYIRGIVPLMLHFVWRLAGQEPEPPASLECILSHEVDLWRKTCRYSGTAAPAEVNFCDPAWTEMVETIDGFFRRYYPREDYVGFERECMHYLWPLMEPRLEKDSRPPRRGDDRPYGAWNVTFRAENVMSVHITNIYRPDSIFDYPDDFANDLLRLVRDVREEYPRIDTVFCGSWLNNLPPFQAFFPPEWEMNLHRPCRHNDTNGIWGQYVSRTGNLHEKNADYLRRRGVHRYPLIHSQCSAASLTAYLASGGRGADRKPGQRQR